MSAIMREVVRTTLARSLCVAAMFAAALVAFVLLGEAPERSLEGWILLASVLTMLALAGGMVTTYVELQEQ